VEEGRRIFLLKRSVVFCIKGKEETKEKWHRILYSLNFEARPDN
jgi:hypothetical protein